MENREISHNCKKCGGPIQDGICTLCGAPDEPETEELPSAQPQKESRVSPVKNRTFLIAAGIGSVIFLCLLILAIVLIVTGLSKRPPSSAPKQDGLTQEMSDSETDEAWQMYQPSPEDEYYKELADAIRYDLSYRVDWDVYEDEREESHASYAACWPQLEGEDRDFDEINRLIETCAREYETMYRGDQKTGDYDSCSVITAAYVTYMDENFISIVFGDALSFWDEDAASGDDRVILRDLNLDLASGKEIAHSDMIHYTDELADAFLRQDRIQNGNSLEKFGWDEKMCRRFLESEQGVAFYTPVGLEIGLNYHFDETGEAGWVTATIKDYGKFVKFSP